MASEFDEPGEIESIYEAKRTSLLDIVEDRQKELNRKNLVHRLVYISKINPLNADRQLIGNHYEKLLKGLQATYQTEPITGLLLIYMRHLIHVIEASSDMLVELAKDLNESEVSASDFVTKSKILAISHDINQRLYGQWSFRTLDIEAARLESFETSESADKLIVDVLFQLLKLGSFLSKQPKLSLKNTMDSLHAKVPDLLPQQDVLHFLLENEDVSMTSPQQYFETYTQPFDTTLECELTWPLPIRLFPYN